MAKHTPGPWGLQECPSGGMIVTRDAPQSHIQVVPEADARLIAAAPDLLEGCRTMLEHTCGGCSGDLEGLLCSAPGCCAVEPSNKVRVAIHKATG